MHPQPKRTVIMILAADIGNTNITIGSFTNAGELTCVSRLNTDRMKTDDEYAVALLSLSGLNSLGSSYDGAVISSVVPELTNIFRAAVHKAFDTQAIVVAAGIKTGLKILIDNPKELGADLVAGAVGAISHYPLPCLIMDLGTATKLSVIGEGGEFLGCTIAAGIAISLDALAKRTSQLPAISLEPPTRVIGTNSPDSIRAGTVLGNAAMLDGLSATIEEELGMPFKSVVATGGLAHDIVPACKREVTLNKNLILEGLFEIYNKNIADK